MDEERKLVTELQGKLAELDQKVWTYGRDLAAEFEKYKEGLLRDLPKELSETVSKAIAASMKDYTALYPAAADSCESGSGTGIVTTMDSKDPGNESLSLFYTSPKPISPRPSSLQPPHDGDDDAQHSRSPHAREQEFQGVFTPSFLPLLGDNRRERRASNERRASYDSPTSSPFATRRSETSVDASTEIGRSLTATPDPTSHRPPTPKRKNTDEVSVASDVSEGTFPRSALRRSSNSSMKQSPRRVRFDFEGVEVLPTSSPLPPSNIGAEGLCGSDDDEPGSEQVEDIEEEAESLPPKRISSSQALRALSRKPLEEDDTIWTPVSAGDGGSASVPTTSAGSYGDSLSNLNEGMGGMPNLSLGTAVVEAGGSPVPSPSSQSTVRDHGVSTSANDRDDDPFDDAMLDVPSLTHVKARTALPPASILSPFSPVTLEGNESPALPTRPPRPTWKSMNSQSDSEQENIGQGMRFDEDEIEELFDFDENTQQRSPPEELPEDSDGIDDSEDTQSPTSHTEANKNFLSRSPARPIYRPTIQEPSQASTILASSFKKNHPFSLPIISEAMHAQAASMGPVNSFVGSMTGRTGFDESSVVSYRATGGFDIGSFTGEPKSMTERMMMDDYADATQARARNNR